jgi:hypothetical protein
MSYNGSGTFQINTSGQPVVTGTVISSSAFNALTADLATGLSTAITKDGQTATTVRIPFAQGINSSLATDTSSGSTGSIYTAGGIGITKGLFVGGTATFSATPVFYALTASSAVATDASKNLVSVTNTGTGNNVLATNPTLVTPNITSGLTLTSAAGTSGQVLTSAGSGSAPIWTTPSTASGTVTSVATGTGLTGGPITSTGTIAIDSTVATLTGAQTLTNKIIQGGAITSGTAVASTSGTSIDFTSIPSWVKRITVMFNGVSASSTSPFGLVQIGSGSVTTTGYLCTMFTASANNTLTSFTAGFGWFNYSSTADTSNGTIILTTLGSNVWVASGNLTQTNTTRAITTAGNITLGGSLDRVRITTSDGTTTFDAGSINILYEG